MKKKALFGAGYFGKEALKEYGEADIICFLDNDETRENDLVDNVQIKIFEKCVQELQGIHIIICTRCYPEIIEQLERNGIHDYEIYHGIIERKGYYSPKVLIENPYERDINRDLMEEEWLQKNDGQLKKQSINQKVMQYAKQNHLFHHIEIETINRCNGVCSFCPVNCRIDPREKKVMTEELFEKIIGELHDMNYSGRISLFSNNEPLLDSRIVEFHKYARNKLPDARFHLYTNGILLSKEIFIELLKYLDELIIDNYQQELELIPASKMIVEYAKEHPEIKEKVTIVLRKPNEILTSRGGDAPNRTQVNIVEKIACVHPFQQMIIRPDGKVSLCCNDPLGRCTMGDVSEQKLLDIWYGKEFQEIRNKIIKGRENIEHCRRCDVFVLD